MPKQRRTFTPEYKEQIARMVIEESRAIAPPTSAKSHP
jgi:transposase-like protein